MLVVAHGHADPELDIPAPAQFQEAWLITVAPGSLYWQRFGHNALWLREPLRGLDHTFNFGYFDFEQERFLQRFIAGRMLYQSLAFKAESELSAYASEGRTIRAQRLVLDAAAYETLRDHLLWHVQPANRDYLYDYYQDNCSTRIRDAIDKALDNALEEATGATLARQSYRDHTRRLTGMTTWYYLGLEVLLGWPVDHPITLWQEMFIPQVLANVLESLSKSGLAEPLIDADVLIFDAGAATAAASPQRTWPKYLALAMVGLLLAYLLGRMPWLGWIRLARAWAVFAALCGIILAMLWGLTDHRVVGPNTNLLLLNPCMLLLLFRSARKFGLVVLMLSTVVAVLLAFVPEAQYSADVMASVLPLNLAVAWVFWRTLKEGQGDVRVDAVINDDRTFIDRVPPAPRPDVPDGEGQ